MGTINTGISLFSLGTPYLKGELDLEGVIREAAEMGAEGYEIVGAQMMWSYPFCSNDFLGFVEDCKDKYGIGPICYSANMDKGILPGRSLTEDEMVARAIEDIIVANKLGCPTMREQYLLGPNGLKRLVPYAEAYNVHVGIEIHNPETPISPVCLEFIEAVEGSGSEYIGYVLDLGCFATKPNKPYWDRALEAGVPEEVLQKAAQLRYDDVPQEEAMQIMMPDMEKWPVLFRTVSSMYGFVQFRKDCKAELDGVARMIPNLFEVHGKCHYVDENLHEVSIPYEEIIPVLAKDGFEGFIVTEFEDEGGYPAVEQTARNVAMVKKLLAECE